MRRWVDLSDELHYLDWGNTISFSPFFFFLVKKRGNQMSACTDRKEETRFMSSP